MYKGRITKKCQTLRQGSFFLNYLKGKQYFGLFFII